MTTQANNCPLIPRQLGIVRWLSLGKTSQDICEIESLTRNTVHSYIQSARQEAGAANTASLVAMSLRKGWIE